MQVLDRKPPTAEPPSVEPSGAVLSDGEVDEDLVRRTWAGDDAALHTLLSRYRPLVRSRARRYYLPGGDANDVVQEGMIGLYRAVVAYDGSRGAFAAFANVCITSQIRTAVVGARRRKHTVLNEAVSLSGPSPTGSSLPAAEVLARPDEGRHQDPAEAITGAEAVQDLLRFCRTTLSTLEQDVLVRFMQGHSYEAIATALGCGPRSVDNALQRVRRKVVGHLRERDAA